MLDMFDLAVYLISSFLLKEIKYLKKIEFKKIHFLIFLTCGIFLFLVKFQKVIILIFGKCVFPL